ncbi:MAG TPA: hypothetical protein VM283_08790 [Armatimonadota bacterium]|nr:hypothetical protein [Armatimonadota bacterium]
MSGRGPGRAELWLAALVVFALTLGIGLRGRLVEQRVNWDGLAAVAHAYDVYHAQPNANLAMIGFVQPPLPALLQLPLALVAPELTTSGLAANVLGAVALAVAALLLLGMAAEAGISGPWRWGLMALFVLHPMVVGPAATGSPMAVLLALLMGTSWALVRWARTEGLRELIAASVLLSGAIITRYEAVFIVIGALIYLAWRVRRRGGSWSKLEGTMITFGLPIVYVAVVWIGANWAIMGDPWYFARRTFVAFPARGGDMFYAVLQVGLVCFFPILALVYNQMRGAGRDPGAARPVAWLVLTAMLAPLVLPRVFNALDAASEWDRLMVPAAMVLAGGYAMVAVMAGHALRGFMPRGPVQGSALILLGSAGMLIWLIGVGAGLPMKVTDAWAGRGPLADNGLPAIEAAELLARTELPPGRDNIVAGWPGFALVLMSGQTGHATVIQLADLPAQLPLMRPGSRLVVLQEAEALVPSARVAELWRSGQWRCYEFR